MYVARSTRRTVSMLLLAAFMAAIFAPAAMADRGGNRRYRPGPPQVQRRVYTQPRVVVRESHGAQVLAGFLGGLILGVAVSHAAPPPDYYYNDPYCDQQYGTLDEYRTHSRGYGHPCEVQVIERRSGRCAYSYRYDQGQWRRCDGNYGRSGGYSNDRYGQYGGQYGDNQGYCNDDRRYRDDRGWNNGDRRDRDQRGWNDRRGRDDNRRYQGRAQDRDQGDREGDNEDRDWEEDGR